MGKLKINMSSELVTPQKNVLLTTLPNLIDKKKKTQHV